MEISLNKIKAYPAIIIFIFLCTIIVPGFLFMFAFKRELFLSLDLFRLSALALSISAPLLVINYFLVSIFYIDKHQNKNEEFQEFVTDIMYFSCFVNIIILYGAIYNGYLYHENFLDAVNSVLKMELAFFIGFTLSYIVKKIRKSKANKSE